MKSPETTFVSFRDMEGTIFNLDLKASQKAAKVLRAVNHPLRQKMLTLINSKEGITVTEIYTTIRVEQSVASAHLGILREAGVLKTVREGKFMHYHVNIPRLMEVNEFASHLVGAK